MIPQNGPACFYASTSSSMRRIIADVTRSVYIRIRCMTQHIPRRPQCHHTRLDLLYYAMKWNITCKRVFILNKQCGPLSTYTWSHKYLYQQTNFFIWCLNRNRSMSCFVGIAIKCIYTHMVWKSFLHGQIFVSHLFITKFNLYLTRYLIRLLWIF